MADLEAIKSLAHLVDTEVSKKLNIINHYADPKSKLMQLYHHLLDDSIKEDSDLIDMMYEGDTKKLPALRDLKSRVEDQLLNSVFFIDTKGQKLTSTQIKSFEVFKVHSLIKILNNRNAKKSVISIAERYLKVSMQLELTETSFLLSKLLRKHYAFINLNVKKYRYYCSYPQC